MTLADDTKCKIETDETFCMLHCKRLNHEPVKNAQLIQKFIQSVEGDTIDLIGFQFYNVVFDPALFPTGKTVVFDSSTFHKCRFWQLKLKSSFSFVRCTFVDTTFENVNSDVDDEKCQKLDFELAQFLEDTVPFQSCSLCASEMVSFVTATFKSKNSPFWMCNMRSDLVSFMNALIESDRFYVLVCRPGLGVVDHNYLVLDSPNINLACLKANGHFEYGNTEDAKDVAASASFLGIDFRQMRTATFRNANLKNVLLADSVLETVHFINPVWRFGDRHTPILYDEIDTNEQATDELLLRLLVQLKRNYEEQRDYSMAGKWFFREMECRRRLIETDTESNRFFRWLLRTAFKLYKGVSDYGENFAKHFMWLLAVFFLWGPLYFYYGFGKESGTVSYDFACKVTAQSTEHFVDAIFYSFRIMTFQATKTGFEHGVATSILVTLQMLLTLILVPLFLLALRRKFRR